MALTTAITIKDENGATVFTKTGLAAATSFTYFIDANNHPLQIPLAGAYTVEGEISGGSPTVAETVSVYLLIED